MNKNKDDKKIKKDFEKWKVQAKEQIFKLKHNKISEDEVFEWLEKISKAIDFIWFYCYNLLR